MYRALIRSVVTLSLSLGLAIGGWWWWHARSDEAQIAQLEAMNRQLEVQKQQLEQVVTRLGEGKRVADILVTDRTQSASGAVTTSLMFVEYDRAGAPMPPRQFQIAGEIAHVDAMVIEFSRDQVVKNDPLRGHSIALFTRIFGEHDAPSSAERIDTPGKIPAFYQSTDPTLANFEQRLWGTFWRLESDESLRKEMGVKVAIGKGVWGPFAPDTLYTITLTPDGNLSRTSEPIRGVYQQYIQALKQKLATTDQN